MMWAPEASFCTVLVQVYFFFSFLHVGLYIYQVENGEYNKAQLEKQLVGIKVSGTGDKVPYTFCLSYGLNQLQQNNGYGIQ